MVVSRREHFGARSFASGIGWLIVAGGLALALSQSAAARTTISAFPQEAGAAAAAVGHDGWKGYVRAVLADPQRHRTATITYTFDGTTVGARDRVNAFLFHQPYKWTASLEQHDECTDVAASGSGASKNVVDMANIGIQRKDGSTPAKFSFVATGQSISGLLTSKSGDNCDYPVPAPQPVTDRAGVYFMLADPTRGLTNTAKSLHGQVTAPSYQDPQGTTTYTWALTRR